MCGGCESPPKRGIGAPAARGTRQEAPGAGAAAGAGPAVALCEDVRPWRVPEGIWGPEGSGQGIVAVRTPGGFTGGSYEAELALGAPHGSSGSGCSAEFRGYLPSKAFPLHRRIPALWRGPAPAAVFPKEIRLGRKGSPLLLYPAAGGRGRVCPGGGAGARRGHGAGVHQPGRVTTCPFSAAALEEGAAGGPGGSSGCARLAVGAAEQRAPTPRAPMPRECPVAGSFRGVLGARSWPEAVDGAVPRLSSEPPVLGGCPRGPAPPCQEQEVRAGLWSIRRRRRRGRGRNFSCLPVRWGPAPIGRAAAQSGRAAGVGTLPWLIQGCARATAPRGRVSSLRAAGCFCGKRIVSPRHERKPPFWG